MQTFLGVFDTSFKSIDMFIIGLFLFQAIMIFFQLTVKDNLQKILRYYTYLRICVIKSSLAKKALSQYPHWCSRRLKWSRSKWTSTFSNLQKNSSLMASFYSLFQKMLSFELLWINWGFGILPRRGCKNYCTHGFYAYLMKLMKLIRMMNCASLYTGLQKNSPFHYQELEKEL